MYYNCKLLPKNNPVCTTALLLIDLLNYRFSLNYRFPLMHAPQQLYDLQLSHILFDHPYLNVLFTKFP